MVSRTSLYPPLVCPSLYFGSRRPAETASSARTPMMEASIMDKTPERVRKMLINASIPTERLLELYFREHQQLFQQQYGIFQEALVRRIAVLVRQAERAANKPMLNRDSLHGFVDRGLKTIFMADPAWMSPLLPPPDQKILTALNLDPLCLEQVTPKERAVGKQSYKVALARQDLLLDLTAAQSPFASAQAYYLRCFLACHTAKSGPVSKILRKIPKHSP